MNFLKNHKETLTSSHYNGLQLLARLGGGGGVFSGLVELHSLDESMVAGRYLFAQAGLKDFQVRLEPGMNSVSCPEAGESWSLHFGPNPSSMRESLEFQCLTMQPILFLDNPMEERLRERGEEIKELYRDQSIPPDLIVALEEIGRQAGECPVLLPYQLVRNTWRAGIVAMSRIKKLPIPPPGQRGRSRNEFNALERDFAAGVWEGRWPIKILPDISGVQKRYSNPPGLRFYHRADGAALPSEYECRAVLQS